MFQKMCIQRYNNHKSTKKTHNLQNRSNLDDQQHRSLVMLWVERLRQFYARSVK